jgi:HupE / UreJ protein
MIDFFTFLKLGFLHIIDLNGYDHILFLVALCGAYTIYEWKKVVFLITFFTFGHSIALALAILNIISIDSKFIEFLISITIAIACFNNLLNDTEENSHKTKGKAALKSFFVFFFGLIHGLGFSNYLRSLVGKSSSLALELLSFNIGLEIGQILILAFIFVITTLLIGNMLVKRRELVIGLSCFVLGLTLHLISEKWIF